MLIDAGSLITNSDLNLLADGQGMQGVTLKYEFDILADTANNQLLATVVGRALNEQTKALSEGFLAGLALKMQGADLVAGQGMSNAVSAAAAAARGAEGSGFGAFGALAGGRSRYSTGSHFDMDSVTLLAGMAAGLDTKPGHLTLGAFFEYGNGSYDTYNSFAGSASVRGDGDTYYTGAGLLARMDFVLGGAGDSEAASEAASAPTGSRGRSVVYVAASARRQEGGSALSRAEGDGFEPETTLSGEETSPIASAPTGSRGRSVIYVAASARRQEGGTALSRAEGDGFEARFTRAEETSPIASAPTGSRGRSVVYIEASARAGKGHNEFGSPDLQFNGVSAEYDSSSPYYSLHLGTGYLWNITDLISLDLYGKYFWTRQEGDSVTLSTKDAVTFKNADSSRLRLGGRLAYTVNDCLTPYIGAAYEHEFDGKARATTGGYNIDAPELRGDTGIGEIGFNFKPFAGGADGADEPLPLSFDLGLQGYTGKREGMTGSLQAKFEF